MISLVYRGAKISDLAADMLAGEQINSNDNSIIETMDYVIRFMIKATDSSDNTGVIDDNLKTVVWIRDFLSELLKPSETE